jgi:hypothetical protein
MVELRGLEPLTFLLRRHRVDLTRREHRVIGVHGAASAMPWLHHGGTHRDTINADFQSFHDCLCTTVIRPPPSWRRLQTAAAMALLTEVKDEPGLHLALLDVFETLVHLVQLADLADHPGAPLSVQPEHLIEVRAGAHD